MGKGFVGYIRGRCRRGGLSFHMGLCRKVYDEVYDRVSRGQRMCERVYESDDSFV